MDLVRPAPSYVLVTLTKEVWKVIETQPAISIQGCKGDWRTGSILIYPGNPLYTPVTLQLEKLIIQLYPIYGVRMAVGGKAQFVFTGGYVTNNHRRFSPGGSYSVTSEAIDRMTITAQLVRLMSINN